VAETPIDDPGDDRRNVAMLWELAGLKDLAPAAEKGFSMLTAALQKKDFYTQKGREEKKRQRKDAEALRKADRNKKERGEKD